MSAITDAWPLVQREGELGELEAAAASPDAGFVLVYGPAGVGKTRLADECLRHAEVAGARTARIVATSAAAALPMGALAPLLPRDLAVEVPPAELLARTRDEVAGDGALLVMVDDAHLLDGSSAVLLTQLAELGAIRVLATVRTGEAAPDAVSGWWRNPRARRVDLDELPVDGVGRLLGQVLGGPVARDLVHRLHQASGGNPLLLRELVIEADRAGLLSDATGTWRVAGDLPPSRRLQDLLADRLGTLGDDERAALDRLACCGPLGPAELGPAPAVEALERHGLVRCSADERRTTWELANPVLGEVVRSQLPTSTRRRLLLEAADRVDALGARRRDDAFRVATWRLDGGSGADAGLLLQAARVARYAHDFEAVRRLARLLRDGSPSAEADVLLGEACYELGEFQEAEAVLAGPEPADTDPDLVVRRATVRTKNLQWGLSDWPRALDVVTAAAAHAGDAHLPELLAEEASVRMFSGQPQAALDVIDRVVDRSDRVEVMCALVEAPSLACVGRTDAAVATAERGYQRHLALADVSGLAHPGTHVVNHAFALIEAGRFAEAEGLAALGHDVAVAEHIPIAQIWFAMLLARATGLRGRPASSRDWAVEAASTARLHGFDGPRRIALSALAVARAVLGDAAGAAQAADELEALPPYGFLHHDQVIGSVWAAWATGDPERARALALAEAEAAERSHNLTTASWLWHDALRLGADGVADRLAALAARSDSALVAARRTHAVAHERGDAPSLRAAAEAFEALGADLLAAEARTAEADAWRRAGDGRGSRAAERAAATLLGRCEGARSPAARPAVAAALTRREREVATLAATGLSAPDIAERLFVSPRTVENHLQKAYAKLGVRSRAELAAALADA